MTPDDIRRYQVYLLENRKLGVGTVVGHVAALRFLYVKTLKRHDMKQDLPYPKHQKRLPIVLSQEEVTRLIDSAQNLFHYTMLLTMYSTGVRRRELCRLQVCHIDSPPCHRGVSGNVVGTPRRSADRSRWLFRRSCGERVLLASAG